MTVKVKYQAIVGKDLKLARRKIYGKEPVVVLFPRVVGIVSLALGSYAGGAGAAVMTVGDIRNRYVGKGRYQFVGFNHFPDGVLNSVGRCEIEKWC